MAKHKKYHHSEHIKRHHSNEMISNDESSIANMPQEKKMMAYPYPEMMDENYNDGISGIDKQMAGDHGKLRKQFAPHKF